MGSLPEVRYSLASRHLNMLQEVVGRSKIIGARYYNSASSEISARDEEGHGSHTASTAAGNLVKDASFFGLAKGRARGGVPTARIAAYKVCNPEGCASADILSAFDDAIADGVDLITISIGGDPSEFSQDPIAIGAFHAMAKGILTVNAAGNSGPTSSSVSSVAPWLFSVAASTTDRLFVDNIILGNGKTVKGFSVNSFDLEGKKLPLVRGSEVSSDICSPDEAENCIEGCIDRSKVHGKILICENVQGYSVAVDAGAAGSIVNNERSREVYLVVSIPTSVVNSKEYSEVLSYKNSTKNPQVEILKSEAIKDSTAPAVAWFSSRGPNSIVPDILKLHIVYMGSLQEGQYSPASQHLTMLHEVIGSSSLENVLVRSYTRSFNGFAAKLTDNERQKLSNADILAAFDDAIADGVDLITISIGGSNAIEFNEDVIAIGAFHAMAKGILTVQAAGNDGPKSSSVSSVAPWLLSVAASSTDRMIVDNIILGNGKTVQGISINSFSLDGQKLPLVHGKEVLSLTDDCSTTSAENCFPGCLDSRKVKGKIIICDREMGYVGALKAGAAGSILLTDLSKEDAFLVSFIVPLPASAVSPKEYNAILSYKNSTK
ncbi:hypothetical protein Q3G72_009812 [Acer saccharum]|nr:hypothetical protein Q3G72_009812 [Acer saccharum]